MTTRLAAEIGGAVILIAAIIWLWLHHDSKEEKIGAAQCEQSYTQAAVPALEQRNDQHNADVADIHAVVKGYEDKIAALNSDRNALAQRVHDNEAARLRASAVPGVGQPPGFVCSPADDGRPTERDRREAQDLEACAANTIELIAIRTAWADRAARFSSGRAKKSPSLRGASKGWRVGKP